MFSHNFLFFAKLWHYFFEKNLLIIFSRNFCISYFAKILYLFRETDWSEIFSFFLSERNAKKSEIFWANFFCCNKCEFFKNWFSYFAGNSRLSGSRFKVLEKIHTTGGRTGPPIVLGFSCKYIFLSIQDLKYQYEMEVVPQLPRGINWKCREKMYILFFLNLWYSALFQFFNPSIFFKKVQ